MRVVKSDLKGVWLHWCSRFDHGRGLVLHVRVRIIPRSWVRILLHDRGVHSWEDWQNGLASCCTDTFKKNPTSNIVYGVESREPDRRFRPPARTYIYVPSHTCIFNLKLYLDVTVLFTLKNILRKWVHAILHTYRSDIIKTLQTIMRSRSRSPWLASRSTWLAYQRYPIGVQYVQEA